MKLPAVLFTYIHLLTPIQIHAFSPSISPRHHKSSFPLTNKWHINSSPRNYNYDDYYDDDTYSSRREDRIRPTSKIRGGNPNSRWFDGSTASGGRRRNGEQQRLYSDSYTVSSRGDDDNDRWKTNQRRMYNTNNFDDSSTRNMGYGFESRNADFREDGRRFGNAIGGIGVDRRNYDDRYTVNDWNSDNYGERRASYYNGARFGNSRDNFGDRYSSQQWRGMNDRSNGYGERRDGYNNGARFGNSRDDVGDRYSSQQWRGVNDRSTGYGSRRESYNDLRFENRRDNLIDGYIRQNMENTDFRSGRNNGSRPWSSDDARSDKNRQRMNNDRNSRYINGYYGSKSDDESNRYTGDRGYDNLPSQEFTNSRPRRDDTISYTQRRSTYRDMNQRSDEYYPQISSFTRFAPMPFPTLSSFPSMLRNMFSIPSNMFKISSRDINSILQRARNELLSNNKNNAMLQRQFGSIQDIRPPFSQNISSNVFNGEKSTIVKAAFEVFGSNGNVGVVTVEARDDVIVYLAVDADGERIHLPLDGGGYDDVYGTSRRDDIVDAEIIDD